jgi:hypothetical protein
MKQIRADLIPVILIALLLAAASSASCAGGYGTKIGFQQKTILHTGYGKEEIFKAAEEALQEVGWVRHTDYQAGTILGDIPPYTVKAFIKPGTSWLVLEGREEDHGAWRRDQTKGEWFISLDGRLHYRAGAATLQDAVTLWSRAVNRRIPAKQ